MAVAACIPFRQEAGWPELSALDLPGSIYDGHVFLTFNDKITLIDPDSGQAARLRNADGEVRVDEEGRARIWEFSGPQAAPNQFFADPVNLDGDNLLVLSNSERLFEVNLARADARITDGLELSGRVLAAPLLGEDLIYVAAERTMLALEADSFQLRWGFDTGQSIWSRPLILNGALLFTSLDHNLYALDPVDGSEIWRLNLGGAAPVTPVEHEGRLFTGSFSRKIFSISPDGKIQAEYSTEDWVWGAPAIADGVLYAADLGGNVYALEIGENNFRLLWQAEVSERAIRAAPVVSGEYLVVAARDQNLYWLGRDDGRIYFSRELVGEVVSDMLLLEQGPDSEALLAVSTLANEEALVAFGVRNGDRRWTYSR
ncbi:MAG: PQQ-binding-like beta-propeller repeat protein [Anaerolineaceae bacterium]|nr:PQQ-binding-like beta-propeller repeat protein [Anaerolineaceae bacterium]